MRKQITSQPVAVYLRPPYGGAPRPFLLANTDLTNPIYYGHDLSLNTSQASQIPPLGSVGFDGTVDVWASTLNDSIVIEADQIPGGTAWAPSPAQAAEQIAALGLALDTSVHLVNTTLGTPAQTADVDGVPAGIAAAGVPLLARATSLVHAGLALAAGGSLTLGPYAITQISYEAALWLNIPGAATVPFCRVLIDWIDSASGLTVAQDTWWLAAGNAGAVKTAGTGPAKADQMQITLTNADPAQEISGSYAFTQSSRFFARDSWQSIVFPGVPAYTLPGSDSTADLLAATTISIGAGESISRLMPLFNGTAQISLGAPSGDSGLLTITPVDPGVTTTGPIYQAAVAAGNHLNDSIGLPRTHCLFTIANTGSGTGSFDFTAAARRSVS